MDKGMDRMVNSDGSIGARAEGARIKEGQDPSVQVFFGTVEVMRIKRRAFVVRVIHYPDKKLAPHALPQIAQNVVYENSDRYELRVQDIAEQLADHQNMKLFADHNPEEIGRIAVVCFREVVQAMHKGVYNHVANG